MISDTATTALGKKLDSEGWKIINATKCASDKEAWEAALDEVVNGEGNQPIFLKNLLLRQLFIHLCLLIIIRKTEGK